jgi:hypothetical protein
MSASAIDEPIPGPGEVRGRSADRSVEPFRAAREKLLSLAPVAASACFHRALLWLVPAMTLTWMVIRGAGRTVVLGLALIAWGGGVYWLWRGSRQLTQESSRGRD